jgi:hypothetical protein
MPADIEKVIHKAKAVREKCVSAEKYLDEVDIKLSVFREKFD